MNTNRKLSKREMEVRMDASMRIQELVETYNVEEPKLKDLEGEELKEHKDYLKEISDEVARLNIFFI